MNLRKVSCSGFDAYVMLSDDLSDGCKFVSLIGQSVSVRAIVASLVLKENRGPNSYIFDEKSNMLFLDKGSYRIVRKFAQRGGVVYMQVWLLHESYTILGTVGDTIRFVTSTETSKEVAPAGFFDRLKYACGVPADRSMTDELWKNAQRQVLFKDDDKEKVAVPVFCYKEGGGLRLWAVSTDYRVWLAVIRDVMGCKPVVLNSVQGGGYVSRGGEWGLQVGSFAADSQTNDWYLMHKGEPYKYPSALTDGEVTAWEYVHAYGISKVLCLADSVAGVDLKVEGKNNEW